MPNNKLPFRDQLIAWRHYLHQHPETAFEEKTASKLVAEEMRGMGIDVAEGIGGTGVVGTLKVGDGTGCIGIRADMDALNIQECSQHDHVSQNPGKMHGCGHDGHTVTLLGAAKLLSERKNFNGTVRSFSSLLKNRGTAPRPCLTTGCSSVFPSKKSTVSTTLRSCLPVPCIPG